MTEYIQFGSKKIDFLLEYSDRKTLGITVTPDMTVWVIAPVDITLEKIKEKLRRKAPWIVKQQSFFILSSQDTGKEVHQWRNAFISRQAIPVEN